MVGGDNPLSYSPPNITAQPGDTVTFMFMSGNHTATQSSLSEPCEMLEGGFNSGFQAVSADATTYPEYTITVNDTAPIWVFCAQADHCAMGMVFSVNAVEPYDFTVFQAAANATAKTSSSSSSASSTSSGYSSGSTGSSGSGSGTCKRAYGSL